MRRTLARRQALSVALFPFLAVLICTMGALIVLLVLVVQGAQASAAAQSRETASGPAEQAQQQLVEDLLWRAEMLREERAALDQKRKTQQLELAHLEDHLRRLQDEAERLQEEQEALGKAGQDRTLDHEFAQLQLDELKQQIATKQAELADAERRGSRRQPAYAILPYEGPHGTNRRPVYIECREEGVVLQPEGIVFAPADFEGPLGPGNPLDAALRAVREHHQRRGLPGEPYPLIVVRPNGSVAFGACRAAMKHWENEFGYELVEQGTELKFPAADPTLAETLQRTIRDARVRQAALVEAMPNRFRGDARLASFRPSDVPSHDLSLDEPASPSAGRGSGSGTGFSGTAAARNGGGGGLGSSSNVGGSPGSTPNNSLAGGSGSGLGSSSFGSESESSLPRPAGLNGSGPNGSTASGGSSNASATLSASANPSTPASPRGMTANGSATGVGPASNNSGASPRSATTSSGGSPGSGAWSSANGGSVASAGPSSGSSTPAPTESSPSGQSSLNLQAARTKAKRALQQRGENWGLPDSARRATAITRPIYVACYADRLILLPDRGDVRAPLVVPLDAGVASNLDYILGNVWQHMDRWGMAILNGYWKPVLTVTVHPGGEARFAELQAALQGSGIELERTP